MVNYIRYANQGATRNQQLSEDLLKRLGYLEKMGITAEVFSGGQPGKDEGGARVGSTRHDHGGAADVHFFRGDRKLDWSNPDDVPIFEEIVRNGKANGITGFGAGDGYMSKGSMHIGMGNPGVWGKNGSGDNAAPWLRNAYNGAPSGKPDVIAEVLAAGGNPAVSAPASPPSEFQSVALAANTKTEPKSNNGILVDAWNRITKSNVQIPQPPKEILGIESGKFGNAASGIGDFAKALMESDQQLNTQIQASAGRGRQNTPVEFTLMPTTMMPSALPLKKKKGSLGGLGGYFA
ncbi:hypothetical protein [Pararhizobium qamdonense]|uniref:hypothetical protein n=1 Tax=Pararhizobium qamdonense TaxID=3031126 RepID=UPI0023E0F24A|nr:hypothetical protein [Pararhizobium qamdonense]